MIDEFLQRKKKKHVKDLNIVPILDMLTTVIFFLLMSTSFIEFTKLTLPPSSTIAAPAERSPPLAPKLFLTRTGDVYTYTLAWAGKTPGEMNGSVEAHSPDEIRQALIAESKRLAESFTARFPTEKSVQLSLGATVDYQDLISTMDGIREKIPDMVLLSYREADARR